MIEFAPLKKTDFQISNIGLGTNVVGGHNLQDYFKKKTVRDATEERINFIDTADIYGKGRSVEFVGEVLKQMLEDHPR